MSVFHTSTTPIPIRFCQIQFKVCTNYVLNFSKQRFLEHIILIIERVELTHSSKIALL